LQLFQSFIIITIELSDIKAGVDLFNDADFFAAHDFFEDLWSESSSEEKFFFQGLVHISVGSFHLISGNFKGALSQFSKGKMKLNGYVPLFLDVDVGNLILDIDKIVSEMQKERKIDFLDNLADKLPKIRYNK
jgi:predicted metal-dependent hydrolase